ncbi:MAG: hypothetical protein M3M85_00140 [bacterium]|nr:hypothetical protein [bacterium]
MFYSRCRPEQEKAMANNEITSVQVTEYLIKALSRVKSVYIEFGTTEEGSYFSPSAISNLIRIVLADGNLPEEVLPVEHNGFNAGYPEFYEKLRETIDKEVPPLHALIMEKLGGESASQESWGTMREVLDRKLTLYAPRACPQLRKRGHVSVHGSRMSAPFM